jgi:formamidopyrimidine-DNA glycosylase
MPELPDLTVFSDNLASKLKGKKVQSVAYHGDKRLNVSREALQNSLVKTILEAVQRSGKEIQFRFSNHSVLLIHLMLAGGFAITQNPDLVKFKILTISFEDGMALVVNDPKWLVTVKLNPRPATAPDALDVDRDYLLKKISEKPKLVAKAFLIDQSILRGIGNAYADEILWLAQISPKSVMGKIPHSAIDTLIRSMRTVLIDAIDQIRRANPDIISGEVRDFLKVHNPHRRQSPNGRPILKEQVASKTTYFTDEQVLYI